MKAVIYARLSSKEQEKEGFSIPAQLKRIRDYAKRKGYSVAKEFVDVESAKKAGRTNFNCMLKYVKNNDDIEAIICHKVDRLCRNFKDYVTIDELKIKPLFVDEEFPDNAAGKLTFGMKVLLAKHYIDNLSDEVKKGMGEKAEQGIYPSMAPLGYINDKDTKTIEIDTDRAPLIRKMFEWYATCEHSLSSIKEKIADEGLTYRTGNKITKSSIDVILKNPLYYGEFLWNNKLYKGNHQPIISKELFEAVQDVFKGRTKPRGKKYFPYTGLITCGHCGCAVTAEIKKGKYVYYHCTGSRGKCPEPYINEKVLEDKLGKLIKGIKIDEERLEWIKEALRLSHKDEMEYHKRMISGFQEKYNRLQNRIDKMYEDKLDGVVTEFYWEKKRKAWEAEQEKIERKIEQHRKANWNYLEEGIRILELANKAYFLYVRQKPTEKRKLLNYLLSNCILKDGELIPTYRQPFDIIAQTLSLEKEKRAENSSFSALNEIWLPTTCDSMNHISVARYVNRVGKN